MTVEDPIMFDESIWSDVSASAKDLVKKMLIKDPKKRITIDQAINHRFFDQ